jgi:hypothetical protein
VGRAFGYPSAGARRLAEIQPAYKVFDHISSNLYPLEYAAIARTVDCPQEIRPGLAAFGNNKQFHSGIKAQI